ncbi:multicopper oxidase family protein [Microtetraspora malaysiensis]|uniref:multicopper oxidase family protein n=1 Tax=Microtetraspora malaysiensis TaxID=161358 RepID=UPI000A007234|nr:multicopper oxidase family protein [Microtetraspora malaysiensis]
MNRRNFFGVLGGAAVAAGVGVPLLSGIHGSTSTGTLLLSRAPLPARFRLPLAVPPVLTPVRSDAAGDHYEVVQRAADVELIPGLRTRIWGYNGIFPGPTIVSRSGRPTVVRHRNELPAPVVVHLHGGRTPSSEDGYPTDLLMPVAVAPGQGHHHDMAGAVTIGERDYRYPLEQRAATLWYHDHRMDFTGPSVWRGLAGFHLVHDDEEDALPLPRGERDLPLMIADRSFAEDGSLLYPSLDPTLTTPGVMDAYSPGVLGDVILVNGVPWPLAEVSAARHRLRLLNASNARRYRLALDPPPPGGGGLVQIGTDAGLLERPLRHDAIEMAPAQRYDVVVDFGAYRVGQEVTLVNEFGSGPTAQVMRFRVARAAHDDSRVPDRLSRIVPLDRADAVVTRTLRFRHDTMHGMTGWTINGLPFGPDVVHARARLGTVEVWRLITDFHHPIHLHLAPFQVLSRGNGGPGAYDLGWKDTLDLRPAEQAEIIVRFDGYPGRYVFHCHNLEHEDMAMMGNLLVA